jgi:hypothetical protein
MDFPKSTVRDVRTENQNIRARYAAEVDKVKNQKKVMQAYTTYM